MAGIFLNGTEFFPSDAPKEVTKIGALQVAANGARTWVQRVDGANNPILKRSWRLTWKMVGESTRAAVEAVALLATTFAYVDQHGTSYTVQCEEQPYRDGVVDIGPDGTLYYDVDLEIWQV